MTRTQFIECSLSERVRIILRTGIFLDQVEYQNFKLHLYSISDFFVEVKITSAGSDVELVRMISGEDVEKYLGQMVWPVL